MRLANNRIPVQLLKEILPRRLNKGPSSEQIYTHLRKTILSGKLKKGHKLLQEKIAEDFRASRVTVGIAFSQLKKDGLVASKRGIGSFVISPLRKRRKNMSPLVKRRVSR